MSRPLRLAIVGATGRMGRALLDLLRDDDRFELAAALASSSRLGEPVYPGDGGMRFTGEWPETAPDVAIDFSGPTGLAAALAHCRAHKIALVTGTTGLDKTLQDQLAEAASDIPVLRAANFSLGVAVLRRLVREAAAALPDWDLDILEAHHNRKVDAPSGTALALGEAAAAGRGVALAESAVYAREGVTGARREGSIGFAVVRGGDIVGEHEVWVIGQGERVELNHRATDRSIFARGAIEAAHWLAGREPGVYDLDAMLADRVRR
ncbi:4-hydroxy-tetrahydrodipicolinate reductase [Dyella sp. BiH032]|uniref:4-hydroxy-tetrahydrodipicolinate reductase n=1 Tax=Dyella sp. BiH032 TaxID=3075430 RepID=UPI002893485E|nr:4-hydroxy-tetrahydrodipicolinate reductase [Dyella sp. BiH032]WNL48120.1 4-hydroxy-tetrahydrodipicolinate reductase [Dyella sp. BiH032]